MITACVHVAIREYWNINGGGLLVNGKSEKNKGALATIAANHIPELKDFFSHGEVQCFKRGETVFSEGQAITQIIDLVSGCASVSRNGKNGRRQILAFVGARQFIGGASTALYPNSVVALTNVEAIAYPKSVLEQAVAIAPEFAKHFQILLVNMIESRDDHIFAIGQRTANERLASFLLHLRNNQARFSTGGARYQSNRIDLPMSRVDISDYLGLSVETISRAFSWLKRQGVINFSDSTQCEIVDLPRIQEFGGSDDFTHHRGSAQT